MKFALDHAHEISTQGPSPSNYLHWESWRVQSLHTCAYLLEYGTVLCGALLVQTIQYHFVQIN